MTWREGRRLYIEGNWVSGFVMQGRKGRRRPENQVCEEGGRVRLVVGKGGRTTLFPIFLSLLE
jgi:hypothetical protein